MYKDTVLPRVLEQVSDFQNILILNSNDDTVQHTYAWQLFPTGGQLQR